MYHPVFLLRPVLHQDEVHVRSIELAHPRAHVSYFPGMGIASEMMFSSLDFKVPLASSAGDILPWALCHEY